MVTHIGNSYGLSFAPANKKLGVRLLVTIPELQPFRVTTHYVNEMKRMDFDEDRGLVFLTFLGTEQIHCYRVAAEQ